MKYYMKKLLYILMAMLTFMSVTSCDDGNELSTQQFAGETSLNAFGPCPVARGGQIRFVGTNMNTVTSVVFPGGEAVSDITVISDKEIRVNVPQSAQVGLIELKTPVGSLFTISDITYLEPISLDKFSPSRVKAGEKLTIEGDYLNLMNAVVFAEGDTVKTLVEHTRYKIVVEVPETAQTGKIAVTDLAEEPNVIESESVLDVVLPSVASIFDLSGKKPGDEISQEGSDFDLVRDLKVAGTSVDFSVTESNKITYKLPENTPDAAIVTVYPASGVEVPIATIGMTIPTEIVATPSKDLRAGDKIVITGKDLDVVSNVTFPGVADVVAVTNQSATSLTVTCPEGFTSGDMALNLKSGISVIVSIETLKPSFEAYNPSPVAANSALVIKGKHLDLVAKVQFAAVDAVEVAPSEASISVTVPAMAETGVVTLILTNNEVVEFPELTVSPLECAFIVDPSMLISTDDAPIKAGQMISLEIANADKLEAVKIDGSECKFIVSGNTLYILTPENAGLKSILTLVSSNGEVDYTLSVLPNSEIVTTLWTGPAELGWSGDGQIYMGPDGGQCLIDAGAKAGDILRIKLQPTAADWCVQIWEGHWGAQYTEIKAENYDLEGNNYYYNIVLTDELISTFTASQGWGGIVLAQGQSCLAVALELFQKVSLETIIWEGYEDLGAWSNQPYIGAEDVLITAGAKPGQKIRVYGKELAGDWIVQIFNGHWDGQIGGDYKAESGFSLADGIEIVLTNDNIGPLTNPSGWGGLFVMQGQNAAITKVTLE